MGIVKKIKVFWRIPILAAIFVLYLAPIYILVGVSLKPHTDLSSYWKFPVQMTLDNIKVAIREGNILQAMFNSLVITVGVVILVVLVGSLTAYPLARNKTKFNKYMKGFILGIMMVPPLSILVPLFSTLVNMGGVNHYWGIIITLLTFSLPTSIFLYTNFIASIPTALDEAAAIDGCGPIRTFLFIIMPQLKPVTASVIILIGVQTWNDYQFSLYVLQSPRMKTVTLAISSFFSQTTSNLNAAAAAAFIAILPIVLIFIFLQKYFIKGMVDSAIK